MSLPLRDSDPAIERIEPPAPWRFADLVAFFVLFAFWILLQLVVGGVWGRHLGAIGQIVLQGAMDVLLVGFIAFMIKVLHGKPFLETIRWTRNYPFRNGFLISLGASLAISVLVVSSLFPAREPPPLEKLLSSTSAVYVFALFGILGAPIFEEIIFRGFLFALLFDIGGPAIAVSVTATLFAFLHIPQLWGSWAGVSLIFVMGFVLSFVRLRANSLIPSFIIHTSYNTMIFGVFALGTLFQKSLR